MISISPTLEKKEPEVCIGILAVREAPNCQDHPALKDAC